MTNDQLFVSPDTYVRCNGFVDQLLSDACTKVVTGPVTPTLDLNGFRKHLGQFTFEGPRPVHAVAAWVVAGLTDGVVHINHPRYLGLFNPTPTYPSQLADRIAAAFNPQLATWTTSPVAVEIERHVIRAFISRLGFPTESSAGHFTTGGSEANCTALIAALTQASPDYARLGARAFAGQPTFYISADSHLAWLKIAHQTGIGRDAVRIIQTDTAGCLDVGHLRETLEHDRADGCVPIMVVATAGTTNAGMIDPLPACAVVARDEQVWLHVDAAWGGALIACDDRRQVLSGIEQADSVTIDAHKWFATTMGCGMFITRHMQVLSAAFYASTTYMPSHNADIDPYVTSVQWSRRFLGLRLFMSLAAAGWSGYGEHINHTLSMGELLRDRLIQAGWQIINKSPVGVLCAVPPENKPVRAIITQVWAAGEAWASAARFQQRDVMRVCVTSGLTTRDDIDRAVTAFTSAASRVA